MHSITFATANKNKYREVQSILTLHGLSADFEQAELVEVQSDSIEKIAREKAKSAFSKISRPVIVEDDGLFIEVLKGFPGPYSSYAFRTLGNDGMLTLMSGSGNRSAHFMSYFAYNDGTQLSLFEGRVEGIISKAVTEGGWGYDPIFIPDGTSLTFAQLPNKNEYSHRKKALEKFIQWFMK